jgi:hypothetical protein
MRSRSFTTADIAAMKASGYGSSTIQMAEEAARHWPEAQAISELIEKAFAGVKLGDGVGLLQAQGIDDFTDPASLARLRAADEKDNWQEISAHALNRCNSSLSFFDAKGMRFHLPAFLLADLRGVYTCGMAFCLTHLDDHNLRKFTLLSPPQRNAVRAYLLHIAKLEDYAYDRPLILYALDEYWTDPKT